jgi:hypothetical protein
MSWTLAYLAPSPRARYRDSLKILQGFARNFKRVTGLTGGGGLQPELKDHRGPASHKSCAYLATERTAETGNVLSVI